MSLRPAWTAVSKGGNQNKYTDTYVNSLAPVRCDNNCKEHRNIFQRVISEFMTTSSETTARCLSLSAQTDFMKQCWGGGGGVDDHLLYGIFAI